MHIPDGFLDTKTWISLIVISSAVIALSVNRVNKRMNEESTNGEKQIPMMGVLSAFIFAAQMLNFPVLPGVSGHFMGGVLASVLLGPFTGFLIISSVLTIQCIIFQDGGLTALGANIFNMGIIGSIVSYYIYIGLKEVFGDKKFVSVFIAGWLSIVLSSSFCALELAISKIVPLKVALPAIVSIHALIGIGEGAITIAVLGLISRVRPDLLQIKKS